MALNALTQVKGDPGSQNGTNMESAHRVPFLTLTVLFVNPVFGPQCSSL